MKIRELRKKRGLTQIQLSEILGLKSASSLALWECGSRKPPSAILPALADALGCTIDELYGRAQPGQDSA